MCYVVESGDFWEGACQKSNFFIGISNLLLNLDSRDHLALRFYTGISCVLGTWVRISPGTSHITTLEQNPNVNCKTIYNKGLSLVQERKTAKWNDRANSDRLTNFGTHLISLSFSVYQILGLAFRQCYGVKSDLTISVIFYNTLK